MCTLLEILNARKLLFVRHLHLPVAFDVSVSARRRNDGPFVCAYWKLFFSARSRGGECGFPQPGLGGNSPILVYPPPPQGLEGTGGGGGCPC